MWRKRRNILHFALVFFVSTEINFEGLGHGREGADSTGEGRRRQDKILYQQPMIIMLYLLAKDHAAELQEKWCFTQDMLSMVFSDLGINSEDDY